MAGARDLIPMWIGYLYQRGRSINTIRGYSRTLYALEGAGVDLEGATFDDLLAWRMSLTVADSTVLTYVTAVRSFYTWATAYGHLATNPAALIPVPRASRRLPRPITGDDLETAIDAAIGRIRSWLILAGYAGLRCVEISRLTREDIYETAPDPYMIVRGKGGKERTVPLSPYVWVEIRSDMPRRGWVYRRMDGRAAGPVSANLVSKLGSAHLHQCGFAETMHQLRHHFGSATYRETSDIRVVQELMGHSDPATTAGYAQSSNEKAVAAVLAIQPTRRLRPVRDQ